MMSSKPAPGGRTPPFKTQRRHVGTEGTTLLFAAHKPTTKKAGKDKYPFKHPHLDTLRYVLDSKPVGCNTVRGCIVTPPY